MWIVGIHEIISCTNYGTLKKLAAFWHCTTRVPFWTSQRAFVSLAAICRASREDPPAYLCGGCQQPRIAELTARGRTRCPVGVGLRAAVMWALRISFQSWYLVLASSFASSCSTLNKQWPNPNTPPNKCSYVLVAAGLFRAAGCLPVVWALDWAALPWASCGSQKAVVFPGTSRICVWSDVWGSHVQLELPLLSGLCSCPKAGGSR